MGAGVGLLVKVAYIIMLALLLFLLGGPECIDKGLVCLHVINSGSFQLRCAFKSVKWIIYIYDQYPQTILCIQVSCLENGKRFYLIY